MRIGFVTCRTRPSLTYDDATAARALTAAGHSVTAVAWDAPRAGWEGHGLLVVRSTWNYHLEPEAFQRWIDRVERLGIPVLNPPAVLRWNARKTYLADLEGSGLPVVPTRLAGPARPPDPAAWADDFGTEEVVVKPVVGASAHRVERLRLDRDRARLAAAAEGGEVLVQPYLPEVATRGEWSAVYLGGVYSHAVRKRPAEGDFRVQEELGGRSRPEEAPAPILSLARAALDAAPAPTAYARVDAVETDDGPLLMELELIEPALYLAAAPGAASRFAEAILGYHRRRV